MGTLQHHDTTLLIKQFFNEQQSSVVFENVLKSNKPFTQVHFENVGVKIMREALKIFAQKEISHVEIYYDWNYIMVKPELVCYDKNKWKTLQQLANWNKEWNQLFNQTLGLRSLSARFSISWMDDQWINSFLQGVNRLPNIQQVFLNIKSKDESVSKMLNAFKQAGIFVHFQYKFEKL